MRNKCKKLEELKTIVDAAKSQGKRIIFANGCFDVLHIGHIRYLEDAKAQGDLLIVGLNSDGSVRRLKGEGRPVMDENSRTILLSALHAVDYIVIFQDDTVDRLLVELKPHLHCKGGDYTPDTIPEKETVKSYGGAVSVTGGDKIQSTRWLFQTIQQRYKD